MRCPAPASALRASAALAGAAVLIAVGGCVATPHYTPPSGTTYYVSPRGDDGRDGTSTRQAWRTLARAERVALQPGDRLLLEGGARFAGTVTLKKGEAGSVSEPVEIGSYGRGRATVEATGTPGISVHNTAGVEIRDLIVTGKGTAYAREGGVNLYNDRTDGGKLDHVAVSGVDVSGFRAGVVVGGAASGGGFRDVTVAQARLHGNKDAGLLTYGAGFDPARPAYAHEDVAVENVEAYRNAGDPAAHDRHTGNGLILGGVRNATVVRSSAHDNGGRSASEAPAGPAGIWAYDAADVRIAHNAAYRNRTGSDVDGAGFGLDSHVSSSVVEHNLAFRNDGPGFYVYQRTLDGTHTGNTIRYNVAVDDARKLTWRGGLAVYGDDIRDLQIYQNTVVMSDSADGIAPALHLQTGERDVTVRNNVFVTDGSPLVWAEPGLTHEDVVLQGNDYHAAEGQWTIDWGGRFYAGLGAWRAATGEEQVDGRPSGLTADPCFRGGELPEVRATGDADLIVPDCASLAGKGLDLRGLFGTDPGAVDRFGRTTGTPPPVGAAVPSAGR